MDEYGAAVLHVSFGCGRYAWGMPRPVVSRLRGNDGEWLFWACSPSPLIPLPSRERGNMVGFLY